MSLRYEQGRYRGRKSVFWGLLLIVAGIFFLLRQMDVLEVSSLWHYWPILIALSGLIELVCADSWKYVRLGIFHMVLGCWLFVGIEHLWGLTIEGTWPVLLVVWGGGMIIDAIIRRQQTKQEDMTP